MNLVNLTPHTISVRCTDGTMVDIPPTPPPARANQFSQHFDFIDYDGLQIELTKQVYGEIRDLPEPAEDGNTLYIVSRVVAEATFHRYDLVVPGPAIRDSEGRIIGCVGLSVL